MASEQTSKQAALAAAHTADSAGKMGGGTKRCVVITSPTTVTWAQGDSMVSPIKIPKGSRPLCDSFASFADMGTSITLDVGLRKVSDGTEYDYNGIAAALDVATAAGQAALNNGALVAAGVEHVLTEDCYLYCVLNGGVPTANAQIRVEASFMFPY